MAQAQDPPLTLDRYATLHAAMEAGEPQLAVLSREAVEAETWHAAHAYWLKRMADEAERKRFETTIRYQTVFSVKRKQAEGRIAKEKAERERPPVFGASSMAAVQRELAAPISPAPIGAAHPAPPVTERAPRARTPQAMPSFLNAGEAPRAPMMGSPEPVRQPGPVIADAPPPAPVAPPPRVAAARRPNMTMNIDASELVKAAQQAATPFVKTPSEPSMPAVVIPKQAAPAQPSPAPRAKQDLGRTMMGSNDASSGRATPFANEGASKPGTTAPPVSRPASVQGLPFRDEPSSGGGLPFRDEPSSAGGLPFRDEPSSDWKQPPRVAPAAPPSNTGTGTAPLPDDARAFARRMLEQRGTAVPPEPPRAGSPPAGNLGSTSAIAPEDVQRAIANLPFRGRSQSSSSFPAVQAPPPPAQADDGGSPKTQAFDFNSIPAHLREALPFGGGAPPAAPPPPAPPPPAAQQVAPASKKRFSINVFASLTAELAEAPHDAEAIRTRYGITEADHHEESRAWTSEFQANDDMRQRYLGIVQRYRGYIQQRKR